MFGHTRGRAVTRVAPSLVLAGLLVGAATTASQAAGLPDPVSTATGGVTGTVTGVTGAVTGVVTPLVPGSSAAQPAPRSTQTARPASGDAGSRGAASRPSAGSPASSTQPRSAREGSAAADRTAVSVDAAVPGLVGACVRITRKGVPAQTTVVVLDHDLIAQLQAAGVPLQQLVVPCPAPAGDPGGAAGGASGAGSVSAASTSGLSSLAQGLAFTGAAVIPLGLAGALLLGLGVLFSRRASALRAVSARG